MKILVFGNPLVEKDSIALQIMPELQKKFPQIAFVEFDAVEDLEKEGPEPIILDAVEGIKKCELFSDLSLLQKTSRNVSMHDFDLGQTLLLLQKMGLVKKATIIGIPTNYKPEKALEESSRIIGRVLDSAEEFLYWVDKKDVVLGKIERKEAHAKKILHRSGVVLVFDSRGRVFLTKRSPQKKIFPNCWDCACSFHVQYGQSYDESAQAELFEETKIKTKPEFLGKLMLDKDPDHLIVAVYAVVHDGEIILDSHEASAGKFYGQKEAGQIMAKEKTTHWLPEAWQVYKNRQRSGATQTTR